MARPIHPFLTSKLVETICKNVREHNSIQTAFRMEGLNDSQHAQLCDEAEADPKSDAGLFLSQLAKEEAKAESEAISHLLLLVRQGHPQAIMWLAERRYGATWGKPDGKPSKEAGSGSVAPQIILPANGRETNNQ